MPVYYIIIYCWLYIYLYGSDAMLYLILCPPAPFALSSPWQRGEGLHVAELFVVRVEWRTLEDADVTAVDVQLQLVLRDDCEERRNRGYKQDHGLKDVDYLQLGKGCPSPALSETPR